MIKTKKSKNIIKTKIPQKKSPSSTLPAVGKRGIGSTKWNNKKHYVIRGSFLQNHEGLIKTWIISNGAHDNLDWA